MKPLLAAFSVFLFSFICLSPVTQGQTPRILWNFDTKDASFGQSAAGDIDGDGKLELVFGCYRNDSAVYALNAEDGSMLWKVSTRVPGGHGCNDVAPLIVDVDGDGSLEVIVPSSCNPKTYCIDGATGLIRWAASTRGSDSPPTVADVDGDGRLEILHGEFGGWVRCLHADDGSLDWELAVDTRSWIQTAPTLLDADKDGDLDFVVATWNRTEGDTNAVRAYRCRDRSLLWRVPLADVVYHGTTVAELDGDSGTELAIGDYSGTLTVMNAEDGSAVWEMPRMAAGHYLGAPISAGDLDGDGYCELVAVSWYKVIALAHDGRLMWEHSIDAYKNAFRGAALADVSGDGLPDAVYGTAGGKLEALSGLDGTLLWSVDLAAAYGSAAFELDHAPVIADLDGDGGLDVFIVGGHAEYPEIQNNFGRAYAVSIGTGSGPEWRMFQHDAHRSGSLCGSAVTSVRMTADAAPNDLHLYPLPVRELLRVSSPTLRSFMVIDVLGRIHAVVRAEGDAAEFDVRTIPSGIYFIVAERDGPPVVRSFVRN